MGPRAWPRVRELAELLYT